VNPKQRYLAAVNRPPTDRPPFDLMDTACGLFDGLLARLKALKGVTSADRSFRKGQNVGRYNGQDFSGGHWLVASANHLQNDIPPENVCALFGSVKEFYVQ
jgi:hypothetical protein